jgi:CDP-diglyceride synthetase
MNGKSQATVIGGAITTLLVFLLNTYVLPQPLPDYVVAAITTLVCLIVAHYTPQTANPAGSLVRLVRFNRNKRTKK